MTPLNDKQMLALMQAGRELDDLRPALPADIQKDLLDLEQRSGNAYASGDWQSQGGTICTPCASARPTAEEAQNILGQAYLALEDKKTTLKNIMNEMNLTPSASKSWMGQMVDNVMGMFR